VSKSNSNHLDLHSAPRGRSKRQVATNGRISQIEQGSSGENGHRECFNSRSLEEYVKRGDFLLDEEVVHDRTRAHHCSTVRPNWSPGYAPGTPAACRPAHRKKKRRETENSSSFSMPPAAETSHIHSPRRHAG